MVASGSHNSQVSDISLSLLGLVEARRSPIGMCLLILAAGVIEAMVGLSVLERHGIVGPNDLLKVGILPAKKIEKLHHDLFNYIYDAQNDRIWGSSSPATDTFSFHASASLRGASGCGAVDCVGKKL